ncbi:hypothetical protein JRQ81_007281 [Phrynocephalus forsythii]|uniref:Fibronectin type-III domain-containing protein n=1 Tax=Phrynocephalus forsythii TaxID=171643 RepID=A0A9Q1AU40_9SAUR|nr:hypothetical protein JRQ81_007281 [Phrynocephalus forsythii]
MSRGKVSNLLSITPNLCYQACSLVGKESRASQPFLFGERLGRYGPGLFALCLFDAEDREECKNYLQRDGIPVGCWLNFTLTNDNLFIDFHVSINSSHMNTSYSTSMLLISRVKVGAPFNLSVKTLENNQLQLHWNTTYKKGRCLEHTVQYRSNKDTSWTKQETEEMKFNVVSMDPEKRYTFYVRSKLKTTCGGADLWSDAGGPIYWGKESTPSMPLMLQVCLGLATLLLLGLLVFILLHMERVRLVLLPTIPNPGKNFEDLFTTYHGNFSEWAGVSKDTTETFKPSYQESICRRQEAGEDASRNLSVTGGVFHDNRQFLANINCSALLLMHYLRDKVGLQRTDPIDLCEENGTLKLLFLVKFPEDSASKFLTPRGTYYICKVERGAPGTKHENSYRAFLPIFKYPPLELLESLRNQCDFLEKSRLKMLKSQDGRKPPTMESLLSVMANQVVGKPSGKAGANVTGSLDEEGTPRKTTAATKARLEAGRKDRHR